MEWYLEHHFLWDFPAGGLGDRVLFPAALSAR